MSTITITLLFIIIIDIIIIIEMTLFLRQYLVAGSSLLASMAVGGSLSYPSILLQQLTSNDTSIQLDWETASWIGSIHGIAGIPSLIMPALMQWRGRRLGFMLACLISIVGWILSYTATSATYILISESFNGFGAQCIGAASSFTMSEMLSPQIRKMTIGLYLVTQTLGVALVQIAGSYLHWRTVCLFVSVPVILTFIATCMWPESPSWLALKGKFDDCVKAFTLLRGTGDHAQMELDELILAQKENLSSVKRNKKTLIESLWLTLLRRDFYLPNNHIFILLLISYWGGTIAHIIYASDIIESATHSKDAVFIGIMAFNWAMFICCTIATFLIKYVRPKKVLLVSGSWAVACLLSASAINYCQTVGVVSNESYICLYLLIGYMIGITLTIPILLPLTAELMPVKHRGVAGPLLVLYPCLMHTTSLKAVPYMLIYINLYGMLLVFAAVTAISTLYTWKYIPETKGRTLQQLEDFYNYGNFDKFCRTDKENCLSELTALKDKQEI